MTVSGPSPRVEPARAPIALVGIGCRFPGGANDPEHFWRMILDGGDAITEIPHARGDARVFFGAPVSGSGPRYSRWGGFIDCIDQFDPEFFGISLREAPCMDPQHRLLLEAAWEALEDGGQVLDDAIAARTGVFVGISTNDYESLQATVNDYSLLDVHTVMGCASSIAANRISYSFDLQGPSISLDTACSSSLVAVHLACRSLWEGESDLALAGGVNALLSPSGFVLAMLSPDGRCKAFDARANGFVRAEGVGMVLLKPLAAALADGNPIYAVIRGTAMNQDGRTSGITVPNPEAQMRLAREACRVADVRPHDIHYVEAHGTGTAVGDPIEAHALGHALGVGRAESDPCVVGSVKTNIGHLESAAGVAGLIKVALMLERRLVPPNLHMVTPNPYIDFGALRLRVPLVVEPLPDGPVLAGVNSFGFGGVNAHAVLSSWEGATPDRAGVALDRARLLPLSARSKESLVEMARRYATFLTEPARGGVDGADGAGAADDAARRLRDICHTASRYRKHHHHRLAVVGATAEDLAEKLDAFARGEERTGVSHGDVDARRSLVFAFGGQGPQWWGMARQLMRDEPVFRATVEECDRLQRALGGWSLLDELGADEHASRLSETARAQPAIFAVQAGLATLWQSWGIVPDAVVGHSVGEVAAAYVSGVLDLESAVRVIYHRGRTMSRAPDTGGMLAVGMSEDDAAELVAGTEGRACVAAVNSPRSVTIAGDGETLAALQTVLETRSIFCRRLQVSYAFHSPQMDPVRDELLASLADLVPERARVPMWSTVTGAAVAGAAVGDDALAGEPLDAGYWWRNVRHTVRFSAAVAGLVAEGHRTFLELSPHPVLSVSIAEGLVAAGVKGTLAASLRRGEDDRHSLLGALATLHALGYEPAWEAVHPDGGRCIRLPRYAWRHQRYWQEAAEVSEARQRPVDHPLLGRGIRSAHPHWQKKIDDDLRGLLADHRVQGRIVFPAAGFVEMALAAGKHLFGTDGCVLEEVEILKPLFVPDAGEAPRLELRFDPVQKEISISSLAGDAQKFWIQHCVGRLLPAPERPVESERPWRAPPPGPALPGDELYPALEAMGLAYGPAFRRARTIRCGEDEALGKIDALDTTDAPAAADDGAFQFHPALLDGCFHVVLGTGLPGARGARPALYLPQRFTRIRFHARPTAPLTSHVRVRRRSARFLDVDLRVHDAAGKVCLEIDGFRFMAVAGARAAGDEVGEASLYELEWRLAALPCVARRPRAPDFLPDLPQLEPTLVAEANRVAERGWLRTVRALDGRIDALCSRYVVVALETLGVPFEAGRTVTLDELHARVVPQHWRVLERHLALLVHEGIVHRRDGSFVVRDTPPRVDPEELWRALFHAFPAYLYELMGIRSFGRELARILSGEVDALSVLFGETSFIESFYEDSVTVRDPYAVIQKIVDEVVERLPEGRTLRILEVGAGTGGLTSNLLSRLPPEHTDYLFTDVTPLFLGKAEQRFGSHPFVHYQCLDLDRSPAEQGYEPGGFDVVLASQVLHATTDLRRTLEHLKELLAPRGLLVALEFDTPPRWVELVFALTKGWWGFTDHDLRPSSPLLTRDRWVELLGAVGFRDAISIAESSEAREPIQCLLVARGPQESDGAVANALAAPDDAAPATPEGSTEAPGDWLIFADDHGVGRELADYLAARGASCTLVFAADAYREIAPDRFEARPARGSDLRRVLDALAARGAPLGGVVFLWGLEPPDCAPPTSAELDAAQVRGCHSVVELVKELVDEQATTSQRVALWLVTRGAQPAGRDGCRSVTQAPMWGLGRVIMNEHPRLACRMVDLSSAGGEREIATLAAELGAGDVEEEIALRGDARYALRLVRARPRAPRVTRVDTATPFRLEITRPGVIDALELAPLVRRAPGPREVEIEVESASLNFRDVMKALGIYPRELDDAMVLGDECAGRVVAVGSEVTEYRVGDAVIGFSGSSLASHVTMEVDGVIPRPAGVRPEEAVTIPMAFITATCSLVNLAQIRSGERVLVHSAAGGVGLAAVQIAQRAGAEVFATAGSPRKREMLRALGVAHVMDSRSLAWADEILGITGGEGVDVVLNALAGDALAKGMSILRPNGRFVEIGKRDVFQNAKLGLRQFRDGISFQLFDLVTAVNTQTERTRRICLDATRDVDEGRLHALPVRIFSIGEVADAFRLMMEGGHVGKIVFKLEGERVRIAAPVDEDRPLFREHATYLLTGGLGGLGLAVARWMIEHGARHLVLVGRSGASNDEAARAVDELRAEARVEVEAVDVAVDDAVARLLERIDSTMPPLAGILHAAMVLDDGVVQHLDGERFRKVMDPKVLGAWNLHTRTLDRALDFFVTFSSITALTGNPGQGNYAAANVFLDSLAHYRRARGLPGLSINWGTIREVGYIARTAGLNETLSRFGVRPIGIRTALDVLGQLLRRGATQTGVMDADWQRLVQYIAALGVTPRLSVLLASGAARADATSAGGVLRDEILGAVDGERHRLLTTYLREQAARVLRASPDAVDPDKALSELGLDSLMAVELANRLEGELGVVLPMGKLTAGQTVTNLADLLVEVLASTRSPAIQA